MIYIRTDIACCLKHFLLSFILQNIVILHSLVGICPTHQQMACLHLTDKTFHTLRICAADIFSDYYTIIVLNIANNKK